MDKRLMLAVAGAGKTTYLVNQLNLENRCLIVTYTNNNLDNLKQKIIDKFGFLPENIHVMSYHSFIFSFCYRPLLAHEYGYKPICLSPPSTSAKYIRKNDIKRYFFSQNQQPYSNRIADLMIYTNNLEGISERLEKYFDILMIDEVQDIAGHDFNFMIKLIKETNIKMLFVGDFYQHTYDTGRDGNVNDKLHKNGVESYSKKFSDANMEVDFTTLQKSYRCSFNVCQFISKQLGIEIHSNKSEEGDNTVVKLIENEDEANRVINDNQIVKLFYQEHHRYNLFSDNWGASKGKDNYKDICIILNHRNMKKYKDEKFIELAPRTLNKLYVACSRARGNIYFLSEKLLENFKIT